MSTQEGTLYIADKAINRVKFISTVAPKQNAVADSNFLAGKRRK